MGWTGHLAFAMVAIRQVFVFFVPETTFASAVLKEALIWVSAMALIAIIRRGEHLPLRSIRIGPRAGGNPFCGGSSSLWCRLW